MATELWLIRRMGHLVPANAPSAESLAKLAANKWLLAEIRMPRNTKHHKKYFALLQAIFQHQDEYPTMRSLQRGMKKRLGFGEWVTLKSGEREFIEDSISFASMDQTEFDQFYERAVQVILTEILPGVDSRDLEREVQDILEGRRAA